MSIPDYQSLYVPILRVLSDGREARLAAIRERVAAVLRLSRTDAQATNAKGTLVFANRVSWALLHLFRASLVARPRRGVYRITQEGRRLYSLHPELIDNRLLKLYADISWEPGQTVWTCSSGPDASLEATARLSWKQIRARAAAFAIRWRDADSEREETRDFYNDFFRVFGACRRSVGQYERHVTINGRSGFIDFLWPGVLVVEQKSAGRDLGKAVSQAKRYVRALSPENRPRRILASDFQSFELHDLTEGGHADFALHELPDNVQRFDFLLGAQRRTLTLGALEDAARRRGEKLEAELLCRLRDQGPEFLSSSVRDLLVAMGYSDLGRGMFRSDELGLSLVRLQTLLVPGESEAALAHVTDFVHAVNESGATQGILAATSVFARRARDFAARSEKRILLINGTRLARLMARHGIGVYSRRLEIHGIDERYFGR